MKLLLGSCAFAALLVGVAGSADAQVAVGDAPIHAIPASDAQPGPQITPPAAPVAAASIPPAPAAPVPEAPATVAAPAVIAPMAAAAPPTAPAAQPMVLADAAPLKPAPSSVMASAPTPSENALVASLKPPVVQPAAAVLTEDEASFFTALGHRVTDAATAYDGYVRHAATIDPGFNDPDSVQRAVRASAGYQPEQLQQGIVAYAAMIALRSPAFVEGVRAQAQADPSFADRLTAQPVMILQVPGAAQAAMDVAGVLRAHGVALQTTGKAIGKAAYDIQAQPWSKEPVANPEVVLANVKLAATQPRAADAPTEKMLLQSLVSAPHLDGYGPPAATPAVVRGMAVAALAVMGHAGDKEDLRIATLLQDALAANCLKLAMLNMNQCLAAAGPHYDDVFCVGEHSVGETARCVSSAADGGPPEPYPTQQMAAVTPPAAQAAGAYGPEQAAAYGYAPRPVAPEDEAPVAEAQAYPQGDGTLNGQIYARRAQMQQQQPQYQQPAPYQQQPTTYAYQDAPPPRQLGPQAQSPYPYAYGPSNGGYAPYGYYAPAPGYGQGGYPQGGYQ